MYFLKDIPLDELAPQTFPFSLLFVACAERRASASDRYQREKFPFTNFEFVLEGEGFLTVDGQDYTLRQGDLYTLPKGSDHLYYPHPKSPWRKMHVTLDGELVSIFLHAYGLRAFRVLHAPQVEKYFREWLDLGATPQDQKHHRASIIFQNMLLELKGVQGSVLPSLSIKVENIRIRLDSSLERKIQFNDICEEAGLNARNLSRQFKSEVGVSPYEYLLNKRLDLSLFLLRYSDLKIGEIAEKLQFSDIYAFSNFFKNRKGLSPKAYRNLQYPQT